MNLKIILPKQPDETQFGYVTRVEASKRSGNVVLPWSEKESLLNYKDRLKAYGKINWRLF